MSKSSREAEPERVGGSSSASWNPAGGDFFLLAVVLLFEGASRLMHKGVRPMLPHIADDSLSPRTPGEFNSRIQFSEGEAFVVCTAEIGLGLNP